MKLVKNVLTSRILGGLELAEIVFEPNALEPRHAHASAVFYLAIRGECTELIPNAKRHYSPLTMGFLPRGFEHSVIYKDTGFHWFRLDVPSTWWARVHSAGENGLVSVHASGGPPSELLWRIYREYRWGDEVSPLVIEALSLELAGEVFRRKKFHHRTPPRWLVQAREFVEDHFNDRVQLDVVAEEVDIHPVHLAREFRRHFDCTMGEYIRSRRIEYVRQQLTDSDRSLVEIALAAGFCDQSHLSRLFKKIVGVSPAKYRNRV